MRTDRAEAVVAGGAAAETGAPVAASLQGVSVSYAGVPALRGIALSIRRGERVAIIGPSGGGKTTLLRLLNTSLLPTAGAVRVLGEDPAALATPALRALRARVGTVWQQLHLVPQASVAENVRMGRIGRTSLAALAAGGLSRAERARVAAVLSQVGLEARIDARLDRLSGGEQQRVAVARVLHQAPELLLADEPLASVDPARAAEVVELLVAAARGRTLVVATHVLEPVLPRFARVVGLREGRIAFDRPREQVGAEDLARLYGPDAAAPSGDAPLRAQGEGPTPLRVAASTTPGDALLPRVLPALRAAYPEVRIVLSVKDTAGALADLASGLADLALVGARDAPAGVAFEDVAEDEIVLVAPPGLLLPPEPLGLADLVRLPRVDREPGSATRRIVELQLSAMGLPLPHAAAVLVAGSAAAQAAAVEGGAGVGFLSRLSVAPALAAGRLRQVRVDRLRIPRRLYAAWRPADPPPAAARRLVDLLREMAAAR